MQDIVRRRLSVFVAEDILNGGVPFDPQSPYFGGRTFVENSQSTMFRYVLRFAFRWKY